MLVFAHGLPADLTIHRNLITATTVVAVNPAAGRQALLSMAATLLEPQQCRELAAQLAAADRDPDQLPARWRPPT